MNRLKSFFFVSKKIGIFLWICKDGKPNMLNNQSLTVKNNLEELEKDFIELNDR